MGDRTTGTTTASGGDTRGGVRWWIDPEISPELRSRLEPLLSDLDRTLRASFARPRTGRKRFYHLKPRPEQAGLFVKEFGPVRAPRSLAGRLAHSQAHREVAVARRITARGLRAVAPVAIAEELGGWSIRRSFSVIPELPARDLRRVLADPELAAAERRRLLEAFGRFTRRLHDAGIDQDDTSPNNFLIDARGEFVLIDFERCAVRARGLPWRRRWHLLAKLERHGLGVSRTLRLRFLDAYRGDGPDRRTAYAAIRSALVRVRRHDARRAARAAFQPGRHVFRQGPAWVVRGREDSAVIHLDLERGEARRIWVLGHQLERLGLPALRPVRLLPDGVDLLRPGDPGAGPLDPPDARSVDRARRSLERYGRFTRPPEWQAGDAGAVLRDLGAFELEIR